MAEDRRVAVVTGGTRGLGAAISKRLVTDGVMVVAAYRSDDAAAEQFLSSLDSLAVSVRRIDVSEPVACRQLIAETVDTHGRVDYLINNAGTLREQKLPDITPEDWNVTLQTNLSAAFHLSQAAIAVMRAAGFGRIVNVGSITSVMGSPFQIDYAAAKAGLVGLTRSMARSVARAGITVNCVIPGGFSTDILGEMTLSDSSAIERTVPVGRYGQPEELAHIVAALVHDDASYVTGSLVAVDGGLGMGM
jgi:NAD(P)-dependent dehydrogenase (short-subunit alcohol dehydrogenase family)